MQQDSGRAAVPVGLFLLPPSGAASQPPGCSVSRTHCQDLAPLHTQHIMQGNQGDAKEQDTEEAKGYVYQADEARKSYLCELQAYLSSSAFRASLRGWVVHKTQAGDDSNDLYYPTCRQFFSSLHNKKEHLLGKQHLQNLTGEFEKDSTEYWKHLEPLEGEEGQNLSKGHSEEDTKGPGGLPPGGLIPEKSFASFNLGFLQEFIFKLQKIKELELRELRMTLERAGAEQAALQRQLVGFQDQGQRLEGERVGLKTYRAVLEMGFENLNVVLI